MNNVFFFFEKIILKLDLRTDDDDEEFDNNDDVAFCVSSVFNVAFDDDRRINASLRATVYFENRIVCNLFWLFYAELLLALFELNDGKNALDVIGALQKQYSIRNNFVTITIVFSAMSASRRTDELLCIVALLPAGRLRTFFSYNRIVIN